MIEAKVTSTATKTLRASIFLKNQLRKSVRLERGLEKKSISVKKKLVKDRDRTLKALLSRSIEDRKDKKGVVGTLGLLGGGLLGRRLLGRGGGGGGLLQGFKPRVPNTPSQLLRMQRGTSSLSRVGRFGKLGRIGPLAAIGTGLDFAGRRAEGQTNLQAGVGAGAGLGGALAGAKAGAVLGTALGGPIGTIVGGVGGSIIGSLTGGRIADLFTGADRRRKFEEQRAIISSQKTLFSKALDDFDRVLDKLEDSDLLLAIRKLKRDGIVDNIRDFFAPPKLGFKRRGEKIKDFLNRPVVQIIGYGALLAGAVALGGITGEESIPFLGLLKALGKTKLGAFFIKKSPFLTRALKKFDKVDDLVISKDVPGISTKGLQIRADKILKDLGITIRDKFKVTKGRTKIRGKRTLKGQDKVTYSDKMDQDTIRKISQDATKNQIEIYKKFFKKPGTRLLKENLNPKKKSFNKKQLNIFRQKKVENPPDLSDSGQSQSNDIALAPNDNNNNIAMTPGDTTVIVQEGNTQSSGPTVINIGDINIIGGSDSNSFEAIPKYVEMTQLFTT